ncbi:unnamed protein product, partial [Iphiclides podalirius]
MKIMTAVGPRSKNVQATPGTMAAKKISVKAFSGAARAVTALLAGRGDRCFLGRLSSSPGHVIGKCADAYGSGASRSGFFTRRSPACLASRDSRRDCYRLVFFKAHSAGTTERSYSGLFQDSYKRKLHFYAAFSYDVFR